MCGRLQYQSKTQLPLCLEGTAQSTGQGLKFRAILSFSPATHLSEASSQIHRPRSYGRPMTPLTARSLTAVSAELAGAGRQRAAWWRGGHRGLYGNSGLRYTATAEQGHQAYTFPHRKTSRRVRKRGWGGLP